MDQPVQRSAVQAMIDKLETLYTVELIMTPREKLVVETCKTVVEPCKTATNEKSKGVKAQEEAKKDEQNEQNFDCIPLIDDQNQIVGLNIFENCADSSSGDPKKWKVVPLSEKWIIAHDTSIYQLVEDFAEQRTCCYLVAKENKIAGIVTPADLQKIPARAYFYALAAQLEQLLGDSIRKKIQNKYVNDEKSQLFVIKGCPGFNAKKVKNLQHFYKKQKNMNQNIDYIAVLSFGDLIKVGHHLNVMGHNEFFKDIEKFRNWIAHPVKDGANADQKKVDIFDTQQIWCYLRALKVMIAWLDRDFRSR
ncbi:MAG: hypothetical protein L3J76_05420 [Candidatus Hydrothermae bacterium]|nr:hypothetical protein [Candidatus Hydrothermae bacterium]